MRFGQIWIERHCSFEMPQRFVLAIEPFERRTEITANIGVVRCQLSRRAQRLYRRRVLPEPQQRGATSAVDSWEIRFQCQRPVVTCQRIGMAPQIVEYVAQVGLHRGITWLDSDGRSDRTDRFLRATHSCHCHTHQVQGIAIARIVSQHLSVARDGFGQTTLAVKCIGLDERGIAVRHGVAEYAMFEVLATPALAVYCSYSQVYGINSMLEARKLLTVAGLVIVGTAWSAQPTMAIKSCATVVGNAERLACFDREIAILNAVDIKKDARADAAAAPRLSPEQKLGLPRSTVDKLEAPPEAQQQPQPKIKGLSAHLSSVALNAAGRQVFTLDNGQVWVQTEPNAGFTVHAGDAVQISSGLLGSFFFSAGKHSSTRVARAQ